jgi:hypothetical protein
MPGRAFVPVAPGQITLFDGKFAGEPTDASMAVRIRSVANRFGAPRDREVLLTLQITPEPKLQWQRLIDVKVLKAVDDKGVALTEPMTVTPGLAVVEVGGPAIMMPPGGGGFVGGRVMVRGGYYNPYGMVANLHHYAPLRLARAATPSKMLKELTGLVTAEVLSESESLLVADDVLKAKGKTFTGKQGGKFKILNVDARPGGQVVIQFEYDPVPGAIADNNPVAQPMMNMAPVPAIAPALPPKVRPIRRGRAVPAIPAARGAAPAGAALALKVVIMPGPAGGPMAFYPMNHFGIHLRDDKGNVLPASVNMVYNRFGGVNREYQLVYNPQAGQGKGTKMVFSGRRNVAINIPFTLKDVKLP